MKRICVWNPAFLGDAVLTLPLLQSLKRAWPEAELDFWVRQGIEPLFADQPELHRVLPVAKRGRKRGVFGLLELARAIRRERYDLLVCAHTSPRSAMVALRSGAALRVGYNGAPLSRLAFHTSVSRKFEELEEIERLLRLLEPLGIAPATHWPELVLPLEARETAGRIIGERIGSKAAAPVLGLHPGSVWPTKRWPVEHFGEVAARAAASGAWVLLFAGPSEKPLARQVLEHALRLAPEAAQRIHDLSGALNLPELAAAFTWLDCYLCNDSGPMHLAWAQRVPVVALFGPTTRELGFYPRGERSTVLERALPCRPCGKHGGRSCREGTHACMRDIAPAQVWQVVKERLPRREAEP